MFLWNPHVFKKPGAAAEPQPRPSFAPPPPGGAAADAAEDATDDGFDFRDTAEGVLDMWQAVETVTLGYPPTTNGIFHGLIMVNGRMING